MMKISPLIPYLKKKDRKKSKILGAPATNQKMSAIMEKWYFDHNSVIVGLTYLILVVIPTFVGIRNNLM